jgi:dihydrodipicolinate synthase/N-acetylneuraminate lyase
MGNIFPEVMRKLYDEYQAGNREAAMDVQRHILRIRAITKAGPTVPIMHDILKMRGIDAGYPRSPFIPISESTRKQVEQEMRALGLLS